MENKIIKRSEVKKEDSWSLEELYKSEDELREDLKKILSLLPEITGLMGKLNNKEGILKALKTKEKAQRILGRAITYASNRSNEDLGNVEYRGLYQEVLDVYVKINEATSFIVPELMGLKDEDIKAFMEDGDLKGYSFMFKKLIDQKPHILNKDKEEILASLEIIGQASSNSYRIFTNSELKFDDIVDKDLNKLSFSQGFYNRYIKSKDRVVRKNAFYNLHETFGKFNGTIGSMLSSSMMNFNTIAKLRGYKSPLEMALKGENIPLDVFNNSLKTIEKNLSLLHRYVDIKKRALKLEEIHPYDLYVDLIDREGRDYSFEEGVELAIKGLKPMGDEYLSIFKKGINSRWIDKYENEGKRSGAYSSGAYETAPYILLNYKGKFGDVSTMVHEMGHSIHSYYTRNYQPFIYGSYSIFLAEVASTCNQKLLIHYLIETTEDKEERLSLILEELEQIRSTVFRQLMFAEFEMITHDLLWEGKALTSEVYNNIYLDLNRKYFGDDIIIDDCIKYEWSRIPHFYNDFYVYQYATGYSAASSFAKMILEDEGQGRIYIDKFLKAGSSKYPVDVLKDAGVDMTSPKPLQDTMDTFKELLDLVEKELSL